MSGAELRQAAAAMRSRAERATSGPWEFRPRRGFQMMSDSPATIGFTDDAGYFVMLREGTWATESDMDYVASWHPAVALAVADWLEIVADDLEEALDALAFLGEPGPPRPGSTYSAALAVARAYLGTTAALPPDHTFDSAAQMRAVADGDQALRTGGGGL